MHVHTVHVVLLCMTAFMLLLGQAVDELLQLLGAPAEEKVPRPSWHFDDGKAQSNQLPLREALAMCYDLRCASLFLSTDHTCISTLVVFRANTTEQ